MKVIPGKLNPANSEIGFRGKTIKDSGENKGFYTMCVHSSVFETMVHLLLVIWSIYCSIKSIFLN